MTKRIAVLGSTGSVGQNALRLIAERRERFEVVMLQANSSREALVTQIEDFRPRAACLVQDGDRDPRCPAETSWFSQADGILEALESCQPDLVLNAITGAAGLPASEWTLRQGLPLALANKESLVMAGPFLMDLARSTGAPILPVDSEHCAIFQCLQGERRDRVRKIYLTASGGPFRTRDVETFGDITVREALNHPTWDMGERITIGSATMMNKAFEVIEARWLFDLEPDQIDILVHPQSIVHSMVEFVDGSIMAQLGVPDMRVPILYCLAWPDRTEFDFQPFDPLRFRELNFYPVDSTRYPAIPLAYEVLDRGGDSGAVLNAADEVLTYRFLDGTLSFPTITDTVTKVVHAHSPRTITALDDVIRADREARRAAESLTNRNS